MKALLTALAVALAAAATLALLVPLAGATTRQATPGMMGTPAPSPSSTMMPTPSPSASWTMMPTPAPSPSPNPTSPTGSWCGGGIWDGSGTWGGTGMWGTGFGMTWLTNNPDALQAWLALRTAHQQALQTWYDTYKEDLSGAPAQQALHDLWTSFWNDMRAFYETYAGGAAWTCPDEGMWGGWDMGGMMGGHDWDANHMWGTGYGAAWMTKHPGAMGRWMTMRSSQIAHMDTWWQQYGSDPSSTAAQAALTTLRAHHRAQVKSFYTHHHLTVTTARMRYGAGGWMGLGGMWGGWGW